MADAREKDGAKLVATSDGLLVVEGKGKIAASDTDSGEVVAESDSLLTVEGTAKSPDASS